MDRSQKHPQLVPPLRPAGGAAVEKLKPHQVLEHGQTKLVSYILWSESHQRVKSQIQGKKKVQESQLILQVDGLNFHF